MQDIECVFQSMTGRGSIFISNLPAAQNVSLLHSKGIRAILSVARSGLLKHKKQQIPHYLYIPAQDHAAYELNQHFSQTYDFIENARKQTNVLVHCMAGVSRSVTIVIAYLLKRYKYTLEEIMSMIHRKRRKINPNPGFIEQLKKYAKAEGINCDMRGDYLQVLRGNSMSRGKRIQSSKEKIRKAYTSEFKTRDQQSIKKIQELLPVQKGSPPNINSHLHMRKLSSFDERKRLNVENQESQNIFKNKERVDRFAEKPIDRITYRPSQKIVEKPVQNVDEKPVQSTLESPRIEEMKKSLSMSEKKERGLSIEEKIKRVRDKVLKNEKVGIEGYIKNHAYNPIYKKSPKKLENSSLQRQNRIINKEETPKPSKVAVSSSNENSLFKTFENMTANQKWSSNPLKIEQSDKQLFSEELKSDMPTLYSPLRMHKIVSSKAHQNRA